MKSLIKKAVAKKLVISGKARVETSVPEKALAACPARLIDAQLMTYMHVHLKGAPSRGHEQNGSQNNHERPNYS